jgi:alkanesulfonate monooxygenase SsuD/methylene tetrahydromethanopterin reductase-like flavin-dependent oxidoreductase (luciferase family)
MVEACPVGLVLPVDSYQDARGAVELTVAAERAGLESVCCGELASYDSMALLGAVAHATERIALESTVVSVTARSGALIAMGASTIADLSNDRYRLGVGFGSSTIGGWHGRELPPPLPMMRAAVTDLRAALAGSAIDRWAGFRLLGAPRPLPIRLAALNPRMIALAGELADGVIFTFSGPARPRSRQWPRLRAGLRWQWGDQVRRWWPPAGCSRAPIWLPVVASFARPLRRTSVLPPIKGSPTPSPAQRWRPRSPMLSAAGGGGPQLR